MKKGIKTAIFSTLCFLLIGGLVCFSVLNTKLSSLLNSETIDPAKKPLNSTDESEISNDWGDFSDISFDDIYVDGYYSYSEAFDLNRPCYDLGTNRNFRGNIVIAVFYIDDDESSWSNSEIKFFTEKQFAPAVKFIEKSSLEYGVDLKIKLKAFHTIPGTSTPFKYNGTVNTDLNIGGSTKDTMDQIACDLGLDGACELHYALKQKYSTDEILCFAVLNKQGISYTRNVISNGATNIIEHSVLFRDYPRENQGLSTPQWRSSTCVHNILLFYGAENFYSSESRESIAQEYYPDDIMMHQYPELTSNEIGEMTAFSVGWTDDPPEVCDMPEWWAQD